MELFRKRLALKKANLFFVLNLDKNYPDLVVSVSNIEGKVLKQYNIERNSANLFHLPLKDYQAGVYFIQFEGEKINLTKKIIKQ